MEIKDFIDHFAEQFDETDRSEFTPSTAFRGLDEYSSIIALSIIAMIDEEYGVTIGAEEMKASQTIEDLFNVVKSRL